MGKLADYYADYGWIKVKRYTMDEALPWDERYRQLDEHHVQETTFLTRISHSAGPSLCFTVGVSPGAAGERCAAVFELPNAVGQEQLWASKV